MWYPTPGPRPCSVRGGGAQGQGLAPSMGADCDAIVDGGAEGLFETVGRFEVEGGSLVVADQQSLPFEGAGRELRAKRTMPSRATIAPGNRRSRAGEDPSPRRIPAPTRRSAPRRTRCCRRSGRSEDRRPGYFRAPPRTGRTSRRGRRSPAKYAGAAPDPEAPRRLRRRLRLDRRLRELSQPHDARDSDARRRATLQRGKPAGRSLATGAHRVEERRSSCTSTWIAPERDPIAFASSHSACRGRDGEPDTRGIGGEEKLDAVRPNRVEFDVSAIRHNMRALRAISGPEIKYIAALRRTPTGTARPPSHGPSPTTATPSPSRRGASRTPGPSAVRASTCQS